MSDKKTKIVGLPPKIALNDKNAKQGNVSSESSRKKLSDGTLLKNTSCFDDTNTLKWEVEGGAKENIRMPLGLPDGSYTEHVHPNYAMMGIVVDGYPVKGVADGNLIELKKPLQEEDNPNPSILTMEEKSFIYKDDGNYAADAKGFPNDPNYEFYKTGTPVENVGEGFDGPVWAKEKIEIDIESGSVSFDAGTVNAGTPNASFEFSWFDMYDFTNKSWNGLSAADKYVLSYTEKLTMSPSVIYTDLPLRIQYYQPTPPSYQWLKNEVLGSDYLVNSFEISPYMGEPQQMATSGNVFSFVPIDNIIRNMKDTMSISMRKFIDKPFLCEKIEIEIPEFSFDFLSNFDFSNINDSTDSPIDMSEYSADKLVAPVINLSFAVYTISRQLNIDLLGRFKILIKTNDAVENSSRDIVSIGINEEEENEIGLELFLQNSIDTGHGPLLSEYIYSDVSFTTKTQTTNPSKEWEHRNNCDYVIHTERSLKAEGLPAFSFEKNDGLIISSTPISFKEGSNEIKNLLDDDGFVMTNFLPYTMPLFRYWQVPEVSLFYAPNPIGRKSSTYPIANNQYLKPYTAQPLWNAGLKSISGIPYLASEPELTNALIQYYTSIITTDVSETFVRSPNILYPEDDLSFSINFPIPTHYEVFLNSIGLDTLSNQTVRLCEARMPKGIKLTLYGSYVSNGSEHHLEDSSTSIRSF